MKTNPRRCGAPLPVELFERMAQVLKLLAHPQRLRIIEMLERAGDAPVHEVIEQVQLPQPVVSLHLNQMRRVGLVASERHGKEIWYRIADPRSVTILNCIRGKGGKS